MSAIIAAGSGHWPGFIAHRLLSETLLVVASPAALPGHASMTLAEVAQQVLLNVVSRPHAWSQWFEQVGLAQPVHRRHGPSFELTGHLIQAAVAGIGIGLVPSLLVQDELAAGTLVALSELRDSGRGYYLAYPAPYEQLPALKAFREWLLGLRFDEP
jgi:DNA-binding transcriptional LysR family regulator